MKHVKYCLLGGQTFPLELADDLVRVFPNCTLGQVYGKSHTTPESPRRSDFLQSDSGLSEMSTAVAITPVSQRGMPKSASVGRFLPGANYRIVAADGEPAKPGEAGELWVSGPSRAIGYLDNKQA
jgi:acyl-CoA synthetase (AMP-forming)/AMP-acid ligase II